jgi:hypothetical protein
MITHSRRFRIIPKFKVPQLLSVLSTEIMSALDMFSVFIELDFHYDRQMTEWSNPGFPVYLCSCIAGRSPRVHVRSGLTSKTSWWRWVPGRASCDSIRSCDDHVDCASVRRTVWLRVFVIHLWKSWRQTGFHYRDKFHMEFVRGGVPNEESWWFMQHLCESIFCFSLDIVSRHQ